MVRSSKTVLSEKLYALVMLDKLTDHTENLHRVTELDLWTQVDPERSLTLYLD